MKKTYTEQEVADELDVSVPFLHGLMWGLGIESRKRKKKILTEQECKRLRKAWRGK